MTAHSTTLPAWPSGVRVREKGASWRIDAPGVHSLQECTGPAAGVAAISDLEIRVGTWKPPKGWSGVPDLAEVATVDLKAKGDGARLRLAFTPSVDVSVALGAAIRVLRPSLPLNHYASVAVGHGVGTRAAALAGCVNSAPGRDADLVVDRVDWDVDPTIHRPLGRRSDATPSVISLPSLGPELTAVDVAALRTTTGVIAPGLDARRRHQLEACGIVVAESREAFPADDDVLGWQSASLAARRHALRSQTPAAQLNDWPSVSAVLLTHRDDYLDHALRQLAAIRYPRFEIVLAIHGDAISDEQVQRVIAGHPHAVRVVRIDSDVIFGTAMQCACDAAEGQLITKIDDDDFYGPEHVWDLVLARMYSGAQVTGKALDWIRVESADLTVFRPTYAAEKFADFVAGGTMLISREDLADIGGWLPVAKHIDRALLDAFLAEGALVYRTTGLGYVYVRHGSGHTAQVSDEHFLTKNAARWPGLIAHEEFGTAHG
ncbi:MAG: glycosyltransferase family 2 protein [Actinomycetes bacterium]